MHSFAKCTGFPRHFTYLKNSVLKSMIENSQQRLISALFVSGDKATELHAPLIPYMDFKSIVELKHELEQNIKSRNLNINLNELIVLYEKYCDLCNKIETINEKRDEIAKTLRDLDPNQPKENDKKEKCNQLKEEGKRLKTDLKSVKSNFYKIEDEFIHNFLNLPNALHNKTPCGNTEQIIYSYENRLNDSENVSNHLSFKQYIDFIDNNRYYMKNAAAEFDIYCGLAAIRYFLRHGQFIQTANPDFARAVLLEANATPISYYHQVIEKQLQSQCQLNVPYLTGGGSLESFLGAITKLSIYPSVLPLKWISLGRLYEKYQNAYGSPCQQQNLYTATQTNAIQLFGATRNANEADQLMESCLDLCTDFYKLFNIHFRITYTPSYQLTRSESLRVQFEMYSPHEQRYVCVGRLSNYTDFVSKRLLFTIRNDKNHLFSYIIGGPILCISRLIGILLEHNQSLENLNEKFSDIMLPSKTQLH